MAWARPEFAKWEVNSAGKNLINPSASPLDHEGAILVINNWRSSHSFPLNTFQVTLRNRAKRVDPRPLIAQRLKRLPAIEAKLRRFSTMSLGEMQDIGGCRAVMQGVDRIVDLVKTYKGSALTKHKYLREKDYISVPKADGYRSYHLIYRYHSDAKDQEDWNGLQIEIQIRSRLQHAWATAVETVDFFTGQALKSSVGRDQWKRFFALMGSAIALREKKPLVPNTPTNEGELIRELREGAKELNVVTTLRAWGQAMITLQAQTSDARYFLLELNPSAMRIRVRGFGEGQSQAASDEYIAIERDLRGRPGSQAVLVGVDSLAAVRLAYPSFFVDTGMFIKALEQATK